MNFSTPSHSTDHNHHWSEPLSIIIILITRTVCERALWPNEEGASSLYAVITNTPLSAFHLHHLHIHHLRFYASWKYLKSYSSNDCRLRQFTHLTWISPTFNEFQEWANSPKSHFLLHSGGILNMSSSVTQIFELVYSAFLDAMFCLVSCIKTHVHCRFV